MTLHSLVTECCKAKRLEKLSKLYNYSGAPYPCRKEKETHKLTYPWLSWLATLLVCAYARAVKVPEDVYWRHFSHWRTFFKVSVEIFCHCLTWCPWLKKFSLSFFKSWPRITMHVTLFTLVVTLELHCSQPIRSRLYFSCVLVDVYRARLFGNGKSKPRSLKVNWSINFFLRNKCFSLILIWTFDDIENSKSKKKQHQWKTSQ